MKLNHECVREMLLSIEEIPYQQARLGLAFYEIIKSSRLSIFSQEDLEYTIIQLVDASYIDGVITFDHAQNIMDDLKHMTWEGHKFLDTIRDNKVWTDTKKVTSKFSSVSITMVETVASNVLTNIISKQMGLS
ncbi:DUF2513 domain-containing protein [Carnobacterium maltaromaticum]|uniref:DUF2513 domain-containing protein n=1 Tax=Carnobacterium maltaromaticum TaxID=2751 RepID=UPI00054F5F83|nr:DUF2513 domain-containing protein [Carnobacterium maltaromaticum]